MSFQPYYTLLASLPPLPRFDGALRLPISKERLNQRLKMLRPDDARFLEKMTTFLSWQNDAASFNDREMIARFHILEELVVEPVLKDLLLLPFDQRTILAAFRRRHRGIPAPRSEELWGAGRLVRHIERNWEAPHFKLEAVYPWVPQVRLHLDSGDSPALERLLHHTLWDHLDRTVAAYDFGFPAVISYRLKWGILHQWLSRDSDKARIRFEELLKEITDGQKKLFH